jgi:hypothetical protein
MQNNDGKLSVDELISNFREDLSLSPTDFPDNVLTEFFYLVDPNYNIEYLY